MFAKLTAALVIVSSILSVSAGGSTCNTGPVQCCEQYHEKDSASAAAIWSLIGLNAQDFSGQVGAGCTPITVIGIANGAKCGSQTACCEKNNINGVFAVGCEPFAYGL